MEEQTKKSGSVSASNSNDVEFLRQVAQQEIELKKDTPQTIQQRFILENNIRPGNAQISAALIFDKFKQWDSQTKITYRQFFVGFSKKFKKKRSSSSFFYMLDPAPFDLSDDAYLRAQKTMRDNFDESAKEKTIQEQIKKENSGKK